MLTEVEEEQFGGILRAVMAAPNKEVRPDLSSGMRQSAMEDVKLYLTPKQRIYHPIDTETLNERKTSDIPNFKPT